MNPARVHIGVDVGKEWLDVCYPDGYKEKIKNIKSCRTKLIKRAAKLGAIISFEATGPYEEQLAEECLARGVKAVRLDAWGTRCSPSKFRANFVWSDNERTRALVAEELTAHTVVHRALGNAVLVCESARNVVPGQNAIES